MSEPLLSIRDLCVDYITDQGPVRAVDHVSLDVHKGEIVGLAGESGSGKSTLAQAVLRILGPPAVVTGGEALFEGRDLLQLGEAELQALRWTRLSMVFQSAMDSLNPVISIREQFADTLQAHGGSARGAAHGTTTTSREAIEQRALELLDLVGIPRGFLDSYAHQLSGGMRQRVGIALALAFQPSLVILDEPTTALDVVVERAIFTQVRALQRELGFAVLLITHDLSRMLQVSDRVAILYAARLAEVGTVEQVAKQPRHPYTQGLLRAFPSVHGDMSTLQSIPGNPPSLSSPPPGCRFHPRCPHVMDRCRIDPPEWTRLNGQHGMSCYLAQGDPEASARPQGPGGG